MVPRAKGNQQNPTTNILKCYTVYIAHTQTCLIYSETKCYPKVPIFVVFLMIIMVVNVLSLLNRLKFLENKFQFDYFFHSSVIT